MKLDEHIREQFRDQGAKGGKKACEDVYPRRTPRTRRKAITARWAKKKSDRAHRTRREATRTQPIGVHRAQHGEGIGTDGSLSLREMVSSWRLLSSCSLVLDLDAINRINYTLEKINKTLIEIKEQHSSAASR